MKRDMERYGGVIKKIRSQSRIVKVFRCNDKAINNMRKDGSSKNLRLLNLNKLGYSKREEILEFYPNKFGKMRDMVMNRLLRDVCQANQVCKNEDEECLNLRTIRGNVPPM